MLEEFGGMRRRMIKLAGKFAPLCSESPWNWNWQAPLEGVPSETAAEFHANRLSRDLPSPLLRLREVCAGKLDESRFSALNSSSEENFEYKLHCLISHVFPPKVE